jgi:hypothetical protein
MTFYVNRVKQRTTTTGTGTITLGAAKSNIWQTLAAAGGIDGERYSYLIEDDNGNAEVGWGTAGSTQTTLTRNPIFSNNSNNAINLSGGADVSIVPLREDFGGSMLDDHFSFGGL